MRVNLTKKDLVNLIYMQLGFSKQISENLIQDFFETLVKNLETEILENLTLHTTAKSQVEAIRFVSN